MIDRRVTRTAASYAFEAPILDPAAGPGKEASQLRRVNPSAPAAPPPLRFCARRQLDLTRHLSTLAPSVRPSHSLTLLLPRTNDRPTAQAAGYARGREGEGAHLWVFCRRRLPIHSPLPTLSNGKFLSCHACHAAILSLSFFRTAHDPRNG